jgi:hypothetical protein
LWISNFFSQIFTFIGSSVIYLSLSEIPIWTHQRQFGLICHLSRRKSFADKAVLASGGKSSPPLFPNTTATQRNFTTKIFMCTACFEHFEALYGPFTAFNFTPPKKLFYRACFHLFGGSHGHLATLQLTGGGGVDGDAQDTEIAAKSL